MRVFNKQIATDVPLNADYTSAYVPLKSIVLYTISANITGTPSGSIYLEASADPETNDSVPLSTAPPTNWAVIADSAFTVSAAGVSMWNVQAVGYNYVRVVYVDGSGGTSAATMDIVFNGKGI